MKSSFQSSERTFKSTEYRFKTFERTFQSFEQRVITLSDTFCSNGTRYSKEDNIVETTFVAIRGLIFNNFPKNEKYLLESNPLNR